MTPIPRADVLSCFLLSRRWLPGLQRMPHVRISSLWQKPVLKDRDYNQSSAVTCLSFSAEAPRQPKTYSERSAFLRQRAWRGEHGRPTHITETLAQHAFYLHSLKTLSNPGAPDREVLLKCRVGTDWARDYCRAPDVLLDLASKRPLGSP